MSDSDDISSPARFPKDASYRLAIKEILKERKKADELIHTAHSSLARSSAANVARDAPGKQVSVLKLKNGGRMTVTRKSTGVTYVLEVDGSKAVLEKVHGDHIALLVTNDDGFVVRSLCMEL